MDAEAIWAAALLAVCEFGQPKGAITFYANNNFTADEPDVIIENFICDVVFGYLAHVFAHLSRWFSFSRCVCVGFSGMMVYLCVEFLFRRGVYFAVNVR